MALIHGHNLTTPQIDPIAPFDTRFPFLLRWRFRGHMQPERSQIRVRNLETGFTIWGPDSNGHINPVMASEVTIPSSIWGPTMPNNHVFPGNIHARGNGHWYTVEVRVQFPPAQGQPSGSGQWSPWSNRVQFLTLTRPNLQILSITEALEVHNHTTEFVATYSQAQNEPLRRFTFSLLDGNMRLIQQFPSQPAPHDWRAVEDGPDHTVGIGNNFLRLTQDIGRFDRNRTYFIRVEIETVNGMRWQQHRWFTAHYLEPTTDGVVNVSPIEEEGHIRISGRLEQRRGVPHFKGSPAVAMPEELPWKVLIDSKKKSEKLIEKYAVQELEENEHIRFVPVNNPEWVVIPEGQKIIVRRVTFGAAMVMHGQLVGGRCVNGAEIAILQTPEAEGRPSETFTFYHYFNNGRRRIVCVKDNHMGHKAMYTSNTVEMPENHAWHLNMKFDWQRMSLRLHNQGQVTPE